MKRVPLPLITPFTHSPLQEEEGKEGWKESQMR
jgi:hypothetical protein